MAKFSIIYIYIYIYNIYTELAGIGRFARLDHQTQTYSDNINVWGFLSLDYLLKITKVWKGYSMAKIERSHLEHFQFNYTQPIDIGLLTPKKSWKGSAESSQSIQPFSPSVLSRWHSARRERAVAPWFLHGPLWESQWPAPVHGRWNDQPSIREPGSIR